MYVRNLRKKGHGRELPLAKTKLYKDSFLMRCVYTNMSDFDCKLCIGREHLTIITVLATTISIRISYMLI